MSSSACHRRYLLFLSILFFLEKPQHWFPFSSHKRFFESGAIVDLNKASWTFVSRRCSLGGGLPLLHTDRRSRFTLVLAG